MNKSEKKAYSSVHSSTQNSLIFRSHNLFTSGPGKVKRTRSNLSWLRKSMRKLNPFQMPQVEPTAAPIASTSMATPRCSTDKLALVDNEQLRAVDQTMQPCTSNPDLFNVVLSEQQQHIDSSRPRQYGRRSNPVRISSFAIESSNNGAAVRCETRDMVSRNLI